MQSMARCFVLLLLMLMMSMMVLLLLLDMAHTAQAQTWGYRTAVLEFPAFLYKVTIHGM